jgi:hypothetical protein
MWNKEIAINLDFWYKKFNPERAPPSKEQAIRDILPELADLNNEAAVLAAKIQENFEELGI